MQKKKEQKKGKKTKRCAELMEESEGFKNVATKIKFLEQQLTLCNKTIKDYEQAGQTAEKEIEEHFAKCVNALAARMTVLLRGIAQKITNQSMFLCFDSYFLI
jgi:uncharacterized protein YlxW (UPF0749 family)